MIIYITGQTGVEKSTVVTSLAKSILKKEGIETPLDHSSAKQVVRVFDIEDRIQNEMNALSIKPFLDTLSNFMRESIWRKAVESVVSEAQTLLQSEYPPQHIILSFHAVFYRDHKFLNCIKPTLFNKLRPDIIIILIDDCQNIAFRVKEKREQLGIPTRTGKISLGEILAWRSAEIMVGNIISKLFTPEPKCYVFPVKHPVTTLHGLTLEMGQKLICYASYPMTNVRNDAGNMREIRSFLDYMEDNFIVFNPGTIDEFRGQNKEAIELPLNKPMVALTENHFSDYFDELSRIEDVIIYHIEDRDYTLVRQAEIVVAYRPFWNGEISDGVEKEIGHALTEGREVYVFSPEEDNTLVEKKVFKIVEKAVVFRNLDELKLKLQSLQRKKCN